MKKPNEIKLEQMEFRLIMAEAYQHLDKLTHFIFCDCISEDKRLVNYVPYLTELNDIVLKGSCSACGRRAVRYIETGENSESAAHAKRVRELYRSNAK